MFQKLPVLESLNLSGCSHLTDRTVRALGKHCPRLTQVNLNHIPNISQEAALQFIFSAQNLDHLDIFDNPNITEEGRQILREYGEQRNVTIILSGLELQQDVSKTASMILSLASVGKCW